MRGITQKKDFHVLPQKRFSDAKPVIATASNGKEVYELLVQGITVPKPDFFKNYTYDFVANKETFQELFGIADRTYQYWSHDTNRGPKICHYAITLLTLDLHPNLKVEKR
ncbi:MAG: hypothetical protein VYA60_04550 [Pseudomonadota bacterium]|nr:hypothetical protein [Pseudomonadota bacterium]